MRPHSIITALLTAALLVAVGCGSGGTDDASSAEEQHETAHDLNIVSEAPVPVDVVAEEDDWAPTRSESVEPEGAATDGKSIALIGESGHLGSLTDASVDDVWKKWQARPSLDGTTAVMTLQEPAARTLASTLMSWVSLPEAIETNRLTMATRRRAQRRLTERRVGRPDQLRSSPASR